MEMRRVTPDEVYHDLKRGTYGVAVSVGRSFQTRLDQGAAEIGQILQATPGLLPLVGPLYFKYRDFPGSEEIAELLKKERQHMMPWLDEGAGNNVEVLAAQLQEMAKQHEMMQQQLEKANEYIKTDQAKWQAEAAIAQGKSQAQVQIQSMRDQTAIEVERIRSMTKAAVTENEAVVEQVELQEKQRHATQMARENMAASRRNQAMKAVEQERLAAAKVEAEITRDALRTQMEVERDQIAKSTPQVTVDVNVEKREE
jgi:hypothetical protein